MERGRNVIIGLIAGAIIGAGTALLLAPTRGKEIRRKVGRQFSRTKERALHVSDRIKQQITMRPGKVDLNRASREDLLAIDGVGPLIADAIIRYREEHGGFKNIDELENAVGSSYASLYTLMQQVYI